MFGGGAADHLVGLMDERYAQQGEIPQQTGNVGSERSGGGNQTVLLAVAALIVVVVVMN